MLFKIQYRIVIILLVTCCLGNGDKVLAKEQVTANKNEISWTKEDYLQAIQRWQEESKYYGTEKLFDHQIAIGLKIANAQIRLGQFKLALVELEKLEKNPHLKPETKTLINLRQGNAHKGNGNYQKAIEHYKISFEQKESLSSLNNLVSTYRELEQLTLIKVKQLTNPEDITNYSKQAENYRSQALIYANQAYVVGFNNYSLAYVSSLIETHKLGKPLKFQQLVKAQEILNQLAPTRSLANTLINWSSADQENSLYWLSKARKIAQDTNDLQLESYVDLEFGYFYQAKNNPTLGLKYAEKASQKAQTHLLFDNLYRAQKLSGDLYLEMGQKQSSLNSYRESIIAIGQIRNSVISTNSSQVIQFNDEIQIVYRQALDLLLDKKTNSKDELKEALLISDKLRLSKLISYFGKDCFEVKKDQIKTNITKNHIATITSIILPNKTVFILQLPNDEYLKSEAHISALEVKHLAEQWHSELQTGYSWQFRDHSKRFYDLIIKPFEAELDLYDPNLLVFVNDGILRNLPMAALFDSQNGQFLIEKMPISSSIGLHLKSSASPKNKSKALLLGLSNPVQKGWNPINSVPKELEQIEQIIDSKEILNEKFTTNQLSQQIAKNKYTVLHFATHGYFGGTAETSFILAYDQKITMTRFEYLLKLGQQTPNLLVLSACETSVGNELSVLGLAGVAAKSGIDSTLGSLWQVQDDQQLDLIGDFYTNLNDNQSNQAVALQKVQIQQIKKFAHPQKWATLNLIGNY